MTKDQYKEMTEFLKEEPDAVMDYLEENYDDLELADLEMLIRVFCDKKIKISEAEKEAKHRELLDVMYDMAEEEPKTFLKDVQKIKQFLK